MSKMHSDAPTYESLTSPSFDALAKQSLATLLARQQALGEEVQPDRFPEWSCEQDSGILRFTHANGSGIEATVQILGSFSRSAQSWEWAWNNPHVDEPLAVDSRVVHDHGVTHGMPVLSTGILRATEAQSRLMIGVAGVVAGVDGVFWGAAGDVMVAMGYRDIRPLLAPVSPASDPAPGLGPLGWIFHMVVDPLKLIGMAPQPMGNRYVPVPRVASAEVSVAPALTAFLDTCDASLVRLGFAPPLHVAGRLATDIRTVVSLVEHPADGVIGFVYVGLGLHIGATISTSFRSDFADGTTMYTSNSRSIARTPSLPNIDGATFPGVDDVAALYAIHRARMTERAERSRVVPLTRGSDPIAYEDRETRDSQAFWIKKGYYYETFDNDDHIELTPLGAVLSAWRGLFPWRTMTERRYARKRADISQRLGV